MSYRRLILSTTFNHFLFQASFTFFTKKNYLKYDKISNNNTTQLKFESENFLFNNTVLKLLYSLPEYIYSL